jgi:hypothetical protein
MIKIFTYIFVTLLCVSCAMNYGITSKEFIEANKNRDGSSFEKAIIILRYNSIKGTNDEYQYISFTFPNSTIYNQGNGFKNSKPYDIITIITKEGEKKLIYFDVSNFYKKPLIIR